MSIFDDQIELFLSIPGLVDTDAIINIEGHEFITNSTIKTVLRSFYEMDILDEPNGDIKMYISLKPEFKSCGFISDYVGYGFREVIDKFGIKDPETARRIQVSYCLQQFSEVDLIEMLYLKAVTIWKSRS